MPAAAHRRVFTRAEGLLAATTTTVAAGAIAHDAVTRPIGKAGIGEGLAIAAAPGADRLVLLGAELRFGARRTRARSGSDSGISHVPPRVAGIIAPGPCMTGAVGR